MKKNILLPILICLLFCCCEKKTVIENELSRIGITKENYKVRDTFYYENKKIKTIRFYKAKSDYIKVDFYESGKKKSIVNIKNKNLIYDKAVDWYENGKLKNVREYDSNGKQIGGNTSFRENGKLEYAYNNDTNEFTDYWENGEPKLKFIINVSQSYHYFNGNFMEKYTQKTKGEYYIEYFNENGDLVFSGLYKKNILFKDNVRYNGKIICYFKNGKISLTQNVINGIPDGEFYAYYENGKIHFIRDRIKNTYTEWDKNGKLIEELPLKGV
ncbi:hypothetical protein [[Flexibacter] sp. ATCC 35103]|uniref:hypothetical protein n=1 Tax=[Flexibacter] sp. ATCC 35103 TaxID=1937528 RepID=UPI0009D2A8B1|nr:hypothetical protein [[Flexibacter] sp. ATCC 35103]OMQ11777.1 hypothetical protein BXU01_09650 [[Flexibacter] sp. ATCC 35103]